MHVVGRCGAGSHCHAGTKSQARCLAESREAAHGNEPSRAERHLAPRASVGCAIDCAVGLLPAGRDERVEAIEGGRPHEAASLPCWQRQSVSGVPAGVVARLQLRLHLPHQLAARCTACHCCDAVC